MILLAVLILAVQGHRQRQFISLVVAAAAAAFQGSITTGLCISRYRKYHYSLLELKKRKTENSVTRTSAKGTGSLCTEEPKNIGKNLR